MEKCAVEEPSATDTVSSDTLFDSCTKMVEDVPPLRRRLIITLSNCHYSLTKIMPRLVETLDKHGYHETNMACIASVLDHGI